jgi:hypothetical protein
MDLSEEMYEKKYLKYKNKYEMLKQQYGSAMMSKGYICPTWKYFFIFDDSIKFKGENNQNIGIDTSISYTEFKEKVNYRAYTLIDESINPSFIGYNKIGLSIANKLTEEMANSIEQTFSGIVASKGYISFTSNRSSNSFSFYRIPSNISLVNINLYDKDLIEKINALIKTSGIKYKDKTDPKIIKMVSFFGEKMQKIYDIEYKKSNPSKIKENIKLNNFINTELTKQNINFNATNSFIN